MKIATSTFIFGSIEKAVEILSPTVIRELEVYEVLVPGRDDVRHLKVYERTGEELSELSSSLEQKGFRIAAISGHTSLLTEKVQQGKQNIVHVERCIEIAPLVKCPVVVTASGPGTGNEEKDWKDLTTIMKNLCEKAAKCGIKIAFECHYGEFISSPEEVTRLVQEVNMTNFGINYDPWHFELAGMNIVESVARCAPWIVHTHLHDVPYDSEDLPWHKRECIPGDGSIDWSAIIEQLKKDDYKGVLSIELHQVYQDIYSDCQKAYQFLSNLIKS